MSKVCMLLRFGGENKGGRWKAAIGWLTSVELQQESDAYDPNNLQFTPIYVIPQ
jgi:hypothetical protein